MFTIIWMNIFQIFSYINLSSILQLLLKDITYSNFNYRSFLFWVYESEFQIWNFKLT